MKRNLAQLVNKSHDLLVIGGGIHGACVAWDATLRGLSVALVDRGDFGHEASANSLKIIHGGLRYLQDANLGLMRSMIRERTIWLRIAPHLVYPLPCLTPTYTTSKRSKAAMTIALKLNDWISFDRNRQANAEKHLPAGQIISKTRCLELLPGLPGPDVTGGAIWYDAYMRNSERLLLSFVLGAAQRGAAVANYVEVTGFVQTDSGVYGAQATDRLSGHQLEIRARLVVNCAGAWVDSLLERLPGQQSSPKFHPSLAVNVITRQLFPEYAVGLLSRPRPEEQWGRMLFVVPWQDCSLIGTYHTPIDGQLDPDHLPEVAVEDLLTEINSAYPSANLSWGDIRHVHWGYLPQQLGNARPNQVPLVRDSRIYDHEAIDGLAGLLTVVGVKYTTARKTAQQTIDLALKKLGRHASPCQTHQTSLYGGELENFTDFQNQAMATYSAKVNSETISHLVYNYGSEYERILAYGADNPAWVQPIEAGSPVIGAEVIHAVRCEMAQNLADVIRRRTPLGATGLPSVHCLRTCARLMAAELGWDRSRCEEEISQLHASYGRVTPPKIDDKNVYS
jgi:glycerol-3-phosphate dehydrogenase